MAVDDQEIREILAKCTGGQLAQQENHKLDFKECFKFSEKEDRLRLCKHIAGFANREGGRIIFGVRDKSRELVGIDDTAAEELEKTDATNINNVFLELFSREVICETGVVTDVVGVCGKKVKIGVLTIPTVKPKPTIAMQDKGKGVKEKDGEERYIVKSGEVYYRYNGTTRKIRHTELEEIIEERVKRESRRNVVIVNEKDIYK